MSQVERADTGRMIKGMSGTREFNQDSETSRQLRSRVVQRLNVPKRSRASSLAAAVLDDSFDPTSAMTIAK